MIRSEWSATACRQTLTPQCRALAPGSPMARPRPGVGKGAKRRGSAPKVSRNPTRSYARTWNSLPWTQIPAPDIQIPASYIRHRVPQIQILVPWFQSSPPYIQNPQIWMHGAMIWMHGAEMRMHGSQLRIHRTKIRIHGSEIWMSGGEFRVVACKSAPLHAASSCFRAGFRKTRAVAARSVA